MEREEREERRISIIIIKTISLLEERKEGRKEQEKNDNTKIEY